MSHVVGVALLAVGVHVLAVVLGGVQALVALFLESGNAAQAGRVVEGSHASVASGNALVAVDCRLGVVQSCVVADQVSVQEVTGVLACLAEQVVVLTTSCAVLVGVVVHHARVDCGYVTNT